MGRAFDTITGIVTAPGGVLTAVTVATGDSLQVKNTPFDKKIWLLDFWAFNQVAGTVRVRSPKLHDNVQGLRYSALANQVEHAVPDGALQMLVPQDTLIVEQSGSAVAGQIETTSILVYYEDLPGISGRFIGMDDLAKRTRFLVTVENSITPGAAGNYSGGVALNASFDLLQANTDYALLGYAVSARAATVAWRGADSGNQRCSGPAEPLSRWVTTQWFKRKARLFGLPMIPVWNSANKANITVDIAQNQAAGAVTVTSIFAMLGA